MTLITTAFAQGTHAARPAAAAGNAGFYYLETDTNGGTLFQSSGSAWVQLAAAVNSGTGTFSGEVTGTDFKATGLTGATAASRYVGATASGAPASGTFAVGDFAVDQTGKVWVCTTAGSPGTWTQVGGGGGGSTSGARVYASAVQSIPNNAWTALAFDSEHRDDNNYHDTVTNNTRLVAVTAGWYALFGNARIDGASATQRGIRFLLNGGTTVLATTFLSTTGASANIFHVSTVYYLNLNDYVEVQVYQNSGGALNTTIEANDTTEAAIVRLP